FQEQRCQGTLQIWAEPFTALRLPKLYNLRTDPFERADITSNTYYDWFLDHDYIALAAQAVVTKFVATFKDFPPRQKAASFTIDQALEKMQGHEHGSEPVKAVAARTEDNRRRLDVMSARQAPRSQRIRAKAERRSRERAGRR